MAKAAVSQMEPLAEAVTTAQAHESQLKAQVASADARAKRLVELKERVVSAQVAFAEAIKDQQAWDSIAKLVEGNTGAKIPLLRYYLARRLKQVTHEASKNLSHMTGGRFTLIHDETAKGNNGRVEGLAVMVKDGWDGSVRTPESLSGGEGFMASLSLALALSEIVSRETGGRKLGALFIDEGFGSLDDETLNQVMDILDGLRSGGRLVGVISHVSSMRARIPAQLVVKRGRQGSTISTRINDNPEMSA
jgi:exonuclease SbcC